MSSNPFEEWDDVLDADWTTEQERAWYVFRTAEDGDEVIWANRKQPLTVNESTWIDGLVELDVEGPRGGTYTIRERYDMGEPAYYADDSVANDLRFADEAGEPGDRLSSGEFDNLVTTLETRAMNLYAQGDYANYEASVRSVVEEWGAEVQFGRWGDMQKEDERVAIFRSVIEHTPGLDDSYGGRPPRKRAEELLIDYIVDRSQEDADLALVRDTDSYYAFVDDLAGDVIDRLASKRYDAVSTAARDVVTNALDDRSQEFYANIVRYSDREPMEYDFYIDVEEDQQYHEMALDVLWDDVQARVRQIRRERGEHDPRPAGLRYNQYDELVEGFVETTIREHRINANRLVRTTVEDIVEEWADDVLAGTWEYAGIDFEPRDADDVFGSVVLHSQYQPSSFNPFARESMRDEAVEVLVKDIHERYQVAVDDDVDATPVPADEYLDDVLGLGITYEEIREDQDMTAEEYVREAVRSFDGDWSDLTGWTFVDELVQEGGFNVPKYSNDWVLIDYGLVERNDRLRRAAWFHRESGDVLGLTGSTTNPPSEGEYAYEDFGVYRIEWQDPVPEYLINEVPIQEAMDFVYDYIGGNANDIRLVETREGEFYVQDTLDREKIDGGSLIANLVPGFDVPGKGFVPERVRRRSGDAFERVTEAAVAKMQLQTDAAKYAILVFMEMVPYVTSHLLAGTAIQPVSDQRKGVGLRFQNDFGADAEAEGVGGDFEGTLYIRPESLRQFGDDLMGLLPEQLNVFQDARSDVTLIDERINEMVDAVDDHTAKARSFYLMLYLPHTGRGAPQQIVQYSLHYNLAQGGPTEEKLNPWYSLMPGDRLDDDELEARIEFAEAHGVGEVYLSDNQKNPDGTLDLSKLEALSDSDPNKQLPGELAREVGWSLSYERAHELFGPEDRVGEGSQFIASYATFLDLYDAFTHVPEKGVVDQGFQWLLEDARSADGFTIVDAYDAFRASLVFNDTQRERNATIVRLIDEGTISPERLLKGEVTKTGDNFRDFPEGGVQYIWDVPVTHPLGQVWDGKNLEDVEQILMAPGRNGYGATHYWQWEGEGGHRYGLYKNFANIGERADDVDEDQILKHVRPPQRGPAPTIERIQGFDDLWTYMAEDARQRVIEEMQLELDPGEDLDWSDLDGAGLDVGGLFIRGLDAAGLGAGRFPNQNEIFPLRLNDIPGVNFTPERPDIPSFEEWRERRYGPGFDGIVPDLSKQRARYMRDISGFLDPSFADRLGIGEDVEEDVQMQRDVTSQTGDYTSYESFYAEEFGESFEDVEARFNAGEPLNDDSVFDQDSLPNVGEGDGE